MFVIGCRLSFGVYFGSYMTRGMPLVLLGGKIYFSWVGSTVSYTTLMYGLVPSELCAELEVSEAKILLTSGLLVESDGVLKPSKTGTMGVNVSVVPPNFSFGTVSGYTGSYHTGLLNQSSGGLF